MNQIEEALTGLISKDPAIVNENANKDSDTFSTMRDLTAGIVSKSYALNHLLPKTLQMHIKEGHTFSRLRLSSIPTVNKLLFNRC